MILISHRGNLKGKNPPQENHPDYITGALKEGFNVEIDVWLVDNKWVLGHDSPEYEIPKSFLYNNSLWCHAKNISALKEMSSLDVHCFWHQEDDVTLTSRGYLWTYPGKQLTVKSICVLPEIFSSEVQDIDICSGICSDEIQLFMHTKNHRLKLV